jgi:hypothetical protein
VYTCIAGKIDKLNDPAVVDEGTKYICYTDQPFRSNVWEIRPLLFERSDPRLTARQHKMLAHLDEECPVLWQDGKVTFLESQLPLFDALKRTPTMFNSSTSYDIAFMKHCRRNTVLDEARKVIELGKGAERPVMKQVTGYLNEGFWDDKGLYETAIYVRYPKRCQSFCMAWWNEVASKTPRDQLSLPYLIWKWRPHYTLLDLHFETSHMIKVDFLHTQNKVLL